MTELDGVKRALVIGLGISGKAAAEKLLYLGKQVLVNDISTSQEVSGSAASLSEKGAEVALGHGQLVEISSQGPGGARILTTI